MSPAQSRQPYGTWKIPLNAASFRTWHGSWVFIAQDPNVNTTCMRQTRHSVSLGKEFSLARADCKLQGSATSPPSTALLSILNKRVKINAKIIFHLYSKKLLTSLMAHDKLLIVLWRNTQAWLKGLVLKTSRGVKARGGSNPSSSAIFLTKTVNHI